MLIATCNRNYHTRELRQSIGYNHFLCKQPPSHVQSLPLAPLTCINKFKKINLKNTPLNIVWNDNTETSNVKSTLFERPQTSSF